MAWRNENGIWRNGSEEKAHQYRRRKASKKMAAAYQKWRKSERRNSSGNANSAVGESGGAICWRARCAARRNGVSAAGIGEIGVSGSGVRRNHERKMAKIMAAHIEVSSGVAAWWREMALMKNQQHRKSGIGISVGIGWQCEMKMAAKKMANGGNRKTIRRKAAAARRS
jgi:hypothetical protein